MDAQKIRVEVELTPEQLALAYWNLYSSEQADFFAALERVAGVNLCLQTAYVVEEIAKRSANGDHDAQNGFQTLLAHAQCYRESATDWRVRRARGEVSRMADAARRDLGLTTGATHDH